MNPQNNFGSFSVNFFLVFKFLSISLLCALWFQFTTPPPLSPPTSETSRPHRNTLHPPVIILTLITFSWRRHQSGRLPQPVRVNNKLLLFLPFHLFILKVSLSFFFFPSAEKCACSVRSSSPSTRVSDKMDVKIYRIGCNYM